MSKKTRKWYPYKKHSDFVFTVSITNLSSCMQTPINVFKKGIDNFHNDECIFPTPCTNVTITKGVKNVKEN